ncbi:hypothetical protein ZWY2020_004620 [Hordeum vulgare]|nr:hypothetical protein ZWY2020_004620 [Hordeum vulgare]
MTDEEMKNAESQEHTDEEIQIDDSPQTFIPPEEPAQGSTAPVEDFGSPTKQTPQAEENQGENPQPEENLNPEQNPQPEAQDEEIPPPEQNPQPEAQVDDIPHPEQDPQPEAQADEIPYPEEHAEENAPAPNLENALVVINPETAMIVSPQGKKQNLQPMQHQPFSKWPEFQKEAFFEERMYFIGENPYDKPRIRHMKFWTRTQLNYYASVLCGRNKIFQHMHIPHVEIEEIPCFAPVLNVLHEAGLLPLCSDICDWNNDINLQFYATLHICGDPTDINTWVLDWMTQHTHFKAHANEMLRELLGNVAWETKIFLRARRPIMVMSIYERGCVICVPL